MGTNYYLKAHPGAAINDPDTVHIGKSSAGWCFGLHVMPERGLNDLADWLPLLALREACIYDEYDQHIAYEDLLNVITQRVGMPGSGPLSPTFLSGTRYSTMAEYLESTDTMLGPNRLLRCNPKTDQFCTKNGEGTWDCITGEFS